MSFELPDLNTLSAQQLFSAFIRSIPGVAPNWTNHNESDPGITLGQLNAWIVEALAYQANAIPAEAYRNMVRWLLGVAFSSDSNNPVQPYVPPAKIDPATVDLSYLLLKYKLAQVENSRSLNFDELREAVLEFRRTNSYLAATASDIEAIAFETNELMGKLDPTGLLVRRALARYDAGAVYLFIVSNDPNFSLLQPGHVLDQADSMREKEAKLLSLVRQHVLPRALLGNPITVATAPVMPTYVSCKIKCFSREQPESVAQAVREKLTSRLQPFCDDGPDWPFGTAPDATLLLPLISSVPGVSAVTDLRVGITEPFTRGGAMEVDSGSIAASASYSGLPLLQSGNLEVTVV